MSLCNRNIFNSIAQNYRRFRFSNEPVTQKLLALLELAKYPRLILEIGSGTGNYIGSICSIQNCITCGVDISKDMLSVSRDRYHNAYHIQADCEFLLPFKSNKFSMIYSIDFIHYIKNTVDLYIEQFRTLRNKGISFTATHSVENLHQQTLGLYFPDTVEIESTMAHSIMKLKQEIKNAGFSDVNVQTVSVENKLTEKDLKLFKRKTVGVLNSISRDNFEKGIIKMENHLMRGIGSNVHSYTFITALK